MVFSSFVFLCGFLPITVIIHDLLPPGVRNIWLLVVSLFFYAWGEPRYILVMAVSLAVNYTAGLLLGKTKHRKSLFLLVLALNIIPLCLFKYTSLPLPIGISFYTFQALSYVIDVYKKETESQQSFFDFAMYISFFPQLIAGPIVRYEDIKGQFKNRIITPEDRLYGLFRFMIGLGKKILLANTIGSVWAAIKDAGPQLPMLTAWIGALCFTFQIYFDFSGYSDMAIGLSKIFGFTFPENFNYPYISKSITEFWRRWHISLGTWFREYVYIPLGGNRVKTPRFILNILVVWGLTGIWHGAGINFLLWGLYYAILLLIEKFTEKGLLSRFPSALRHVLTLFFVVIGWVIFEAESLPWLLSYLGSLFGAFGLLGDLSLYYLVSYAPTLILLAVLSTPAALRLKDFFKPTDSAKTLVGYLSCLALLVLCFIFLVGESYNPFLYFRF